MSVCLYSQYTGFPVLTHVHGVLITVFFLKKNFVVFVLGGEYWVMSMRSL